MLEISSQPMALLSLIQTTPGATSPIVQWLKICLAMQETPVRALVGEPGSHMLCSEKARMLQLDGPCSPRDAMKILMCHSQDPINKCEK